MNLLLERRITNNNDEADMKRSVVNGRKRQAIEMSRQLQCGAVNYYVSLHPGTLQGRHTASGSIPQTTNGTRTAHLVFLGLVLEGVRALGFNRGGAKPKPKPNSGRRTGPK